MIYLAKGRFNCEKCGRFAWLVDIDEPGAEYVEQWGAWCKRHAPRWAVDDLQAQKKWDEEQRRAAPEAR